MKLFVAGTSGNPSGRPKSSARSVRGMVTRFVTRNITPNKLQKMFSTLKEREQLEFLIQLLPYTIAKQTPEGISSEEIEKLHAMVEDAIKQKREAI